MTDRLGKIKTRSLSALSDGSDTGSPDNGNAEAVRKATHEIAGAFFSISGAAALLKVSLERDEEITAIVEHLKDACQDFKYRLGNLVEYTKRQAGLRDKRLDAVPFRPFISRMLLECTPFAEEYGVAIDAEYKGSIPENIVSDEFRLAIVLSNLLRYAIISTPVGGRVVLTIHSETVTDLTIVLNNSDKVPKVSPVPLGLGQT